MINVSSLCILEKCHFIPIFKRLFNDAADNRDHLWKGSTFDYASILNLNICKVFLVEYIHN